MCTPGYDVTLDRFMRVAHPLPRPRGNVAARRNHTFVNALPWMCRAGAPWSGLPECYGRWVTVSGGSAAGPGTARWSACSRHCGRSGSSGRRSGCSPWTPRARRSTGTRPGRRRRGLPGAEHGRTRLQPHEALPHKAATRYDRLDESFLADLRLILVAIYLKNTAKNPTSVNTL